MKKNIMVVKDQDGNGKDLFLSYNVDHIESNVYKISGQLRSSYTSTTQLENVILEERDHDGNVVRRFKNGNVLEINRWPEPDVVIQALIDEK